MSSEHLASAETELKGELGAAWNILSGANANYTDLGIARRFGGAAAAYSLRDIGAMNGSVVRVRREPHDTNATINDEANFSASQVSSGSLEDWVNGKQETTLPADVATAAAAYSLRKVKASYAEDAVRIRRSSDSVEVNVAFDSDNKVSASSAITNTTEQGGESGSTTATTLGGFLTEDVNIFTDSSSQSWANIRSTDSFETSTALGGEVNYRKFTPNSGTGTSALLGISSFFDVSASSTYTISGQVYVPSGQTTVNAFKIVNGTSGSSPSLSGATNTVPATDQWVDFSFTSAIPTATQLYINAAKDQNAFFSPNGSDFIAFKDITVSATDSGATVHTWYDQAGSNNAVQETAANQPQIASSGALLDGIKFNADANGSSPDFLETDSKLGDTTDFFLSTVIGEAQGQTNFGGIITSRSAADEGFAFGLNGSEKAQAFIYSSGGNTNDTSDEVVGTPKRLLSLDRDSTTINGSVNGAPSYSFTSNTMGSVTEDKSIIGYGGRTDSISDSLGLRANINELIFYETDQAANRFLIESNINNYYNLYNDEYEWDDATNTEWQNNVTDGTTTFTPNGKDGFTITATGANISSFKYRFTSPSSASNDYYKVSFNVNDPDGLLEDAQLRLTATGAGATAQTITNGFNSLSLRTGSSFEYMSINLDGDGSSKTATLSDFKISRIARDGFVETWYDQSSSGNNATQTTASQQPKVVENGGVVKNVKGFPSLKFEFIPRTELDIGLLISNLNSVSAYVVTQKDDGDTNVMAGFTQGVSSDNSRFYLPFYTGGTTPNLGYNDTASKISFGTTLTRTCNLYSAFSGDTNIEAFKNGSSVGTTALVDKAVTATDSKIGQLSNSFYLDGLISEIFLTTRKLQSDASVINNDVINYYNL
jgi:hypothetical protein